MYETNNNGEYYETFIDWCTGQRSAAVVSEVVL